jgi:hypothetical protein
VPKVYGKYRQEKGRVEEFKDSDIGLKCCMKYFQEIFKLFYREESAAYEVLPNSDFKTFKI